MPGQRLYGLPAPLVVTTNSSGLAVVTWPAMLEPPVVALTVENPSTTQGAWADVLLNSITTTGCTIRAWRTQAIPAIIGALGVQPAVPYAGARVHVRPWGTVA